MILKINLWKVNLLEINNITLLTTKRSKSLKRLLFYLFHYFIIFFKRKYFFDLKSFYLHLKYPGHDAVVRSVVNGLEQLNINYNLNPSKSSDFNELVVVLTDANQLKKAIDLKVKNKIKYLIVGPIFSIYSYEHSYILDNKNIDLILTPSKWTSDRYMSDLPSISDKILEWYAGANTFYWNDHKIKRDYITIYIKENMSKYLPNVEKYISFIRQKYNKKIYIINHGHYNNKYFLKILNKSKFSIFFTYSESQGLAQIESWATNTPTLIWKNETYQNNNKNYKNSTSPYLNSNCGIFFDDFKDFREKFIFLEKNMNTFSPRSWVKENMTDKNSVKKLIKIIDNEIIKKI